MSTAERPRYAMTGLDWSVLCLCAICWGSSYSFNRIVLQELPPLTIAASRLVLASLFLVAVARLNGLTLPPPGRVWRQFAVFTMFSNVVPFLLILHGQRETASGLAAVIGAATPLFTLLLAHVFTHDERLETRKTVGVVIGIIGVVVVVGFGALGAGGGLASKLALVAAAMLYAAGAIYSKRIVGIPPMLMAAMQMLAGMTVTLPLALAIDQPWQLPVPSTLAVMALAGTAILGSALAAVSYFYVMRRAGATNAMLVTLLVPVTPILIGALAFGERLLPREMIGAAIVASALLVIDGRLFNRLAAAWTRARAGGSA